MVIALLIIVARRFGIIDKTFYDEHHFAFWMETVAVFFFGILYALEKIFHCEFFSFSGSCDPGKQQ